MSDRPHLEPGADHPITVSPKDRPVTIRFGGLEVASTSHALGLQESNYPEVLYVPVGDVVEGALRPNDQHTYCPYKGEASYYDLIAGDKESAGAVWYYADPYPAVKEIAGHVAFYTDRVEITQG
jgi:uncharacterized protein (DUF427 family)